MTTNSKEYMNKYMQAYTKNSMPIHCDLCNINTKKYLYRSHEKTKKHKQILLKLQDKSINNQ